MTILIRQLLLFVIVGVIQVVIDTGVLIGITSIGVGIVIANIAGRLTGACAGFFLNGTATFSHQTQRRLHGTHLARFIISWIALTLVSTLLLFLLRKHLSLESIWMAKPAIEIFLAAISFFLSKFWIYK